MCRIGDIGPYSADNVFVGQGKQNVSDGNIGRPTSDETKAKMSAASIGKPKPWLALSLLRLNMRLLTQLV